MPEAYLVDAVRTPSGRARDGGLWAGTHPADLLALALSALVDRTGIDPAAIGDVIAGCVTQSGEQAMNVGRTAALSAGLPEHVPATTVDRQCGSSQQALHFAAQAVLAGSEDLVVACGVESMSRSPMWSNWLDRSPYGAGVATRFPGGLLPQGPAAELVCARHDIGRDELDAYALESHRRAAAATEAGLFAAELVDDGRAAADETIRTDGSMESLGALPPAFHDAEVGARFPEIGWHVTAGNSSPLTDGAAAVLVASEAAVARYDLQPRARVHSMAVVGADPVLMLTAVLPATERALARGGLGIEDIGAAEVNEAFACVPLLWQQQFDLDPARLNARGGAIALGHPLGASGARLLTTLLGVLEGTGERFGLQTMCEAGGMANALVVESLGATR